MATQFRQLGPEDAEALAGHLITWHRQEGGTLDPAYAGRVVKLTHKGAYNTMSEAYERIHAHTKANNLKEKPIAWEEYVSDPGETADTELLTNVYIAIE